MGDGKDFDVDAYLEEALEKSQTVENGDSKGERKRSDRSRSPQERSRR
jgi:hypothetical protein